MKRKKRRNKSIAEIKELKGNRCQQKEGEGKGKKVIGKKGTERKKKAERNEKQ